MKVLMVPADQTREKNPFNFLLNRALREIGVTIVSGSTVGEALSKKDVLHLHWPHNFASSPSILRSLWRSILFAGGCIYHKLRGASIVWTVHEFESLDVLHPRLEHLLMNWFERQVDGLILLTENAQNWLNQVRPRLRSIPARIIPHGVYADCYPPPTGQKEARNQLGLPHDKVTIGVIGDLKPYKSADKVLGAVIELGSNSPHVLVAGQCNNSDYKLKINKLIEKAIIAGVPITYIDRRPTHEELASMIDAVDAVVLNYAKSFNSGLAMLSLERRRRILASTQPAFMALQAQLGSYWLSISDECHYPRLFRNFSPRMPSNSEVAVLEEFMSARSWDKIARQTMEFYQELRV